MRMFRALLVFSLIYSIESRSLNSNETAELISKYAKVVKWGTNDNRSTSQADEGRSNSGQALWAHSADVNIIGSQNSKPNVVRRYPVYSKPSAKVDHVKIEKIPAIGEVIQERFNARPYFGYGQIPPSNQNSATYAPATRPTAAPVQAAPKPPVANTPPPLSFPAVFNVAPASFKPPVDLYTSPYNSYNPPTDVKPDLSKDSYPPASGAVDSYAAPPSTDGDGPYGYKIPDQSSKPSTGTLGPPVAPDHNHDHDHHYHYDEVDAPPSSYDHGDMGDSMPPDDSANMPAAGDGPPNHPPKSLEDIYYPPDFPMDHDHPKAADSLPPADMTADLSPPVSHDEHFPKYLYDDPHFDHHIYEEVPHTTTQATEDKRVSSTNYSYYYLGRKLWYIPLYFSIYFMVYIAVLILKSIARHKISLKNEWASSHSRSARQMTFDQIESVDKVHNNISRALDTAQKMYNGFVM